MAEGYFVAWWNVENLFDEEHSPRRSEKLHRALGESLVGWTVALRDRKVARLASVIALMNEGAGPDLLGVREVENEFVMDLLADAIQGALAGRDYRVVHADTGDQRGIDVAFIYDASLFTVPVGQVRSRAGSLSRPHTARSPVRPSPTSTSGARRSTEPRRRC